MLRIIVIGGNGQLGSELSNYFENFGHVVFRWSHEDIEITNYQESYFSIDNINADLVINTAAMHDVEKCEEYPNLAYSINALGVKNLAVISSKLEIPFVHFSTDYVFDGEKGEPYYEDDPTSPINEYGRTKLVGERFIQEHTDKYFIIRVCGLYGRFKCRAKTSENFVNLMLKLALDRREIKVVDYEILSPTYTLTIAEQLNELIKTTSFGVYHMTSNGGCSWFEFARKIFQLSGQSVDVIKASKHDFSGKTQRPLFSVLANGRLLAEGIEKMPGWDRALERYLSDSNLIGLSSEISL